MNAIDGHLDDKHGCQFQEVNCPTDCEVACQRQYLMNHKTECPRRKVNCWYCHDTGEQQFIEGQHKEECPKLPLPCLNKCEVGNIPREELARHTDRCLLQQIQCKYSIIT